MNDEVYNLTKEALTEIGKNTKISINLNGKSGAACLTFLGLCATGVLTYGIYCWHDVQTS